jgi:hypothetical protein
MPRSECGLARWLAVASRKRRESQGWGLAERARLSQRLLKRRWMMAAIWRPSALTNYVTLPIAWHGT